MLFTSIFFIYIFLPSTVILFYIFGRQKKEILQLFLIIVSSIFYGILNIYYLVLIYTSIFFNYLFSSLIVSNKKKSHLFLTIGILFNIFFLGFFKYYNFFISGINESFTFGFVEKTIIFPIGISFFTFQQISFLVDLKKKEIHAHSIIDYVLCVMFFPKLLAGPIIKWNEFIFQFKDKKFGKFNSKYISTGMCLFILGLFKKVIIADNIEVFSDNMFLSLTAEENGYVSAWLGMIAFMLQIYFDFSAYSNIAVGIALLFGIYIPINFNFPYLRTSLIEFWKNWHQTLTLFLKSYIYIPLGGNRKGIYRKYQNILITMSIAGIWHGSGINFLLWGLSHGIALVINHEYVRRKYYFPDILGWISTLLFVSLTWMLFRSPNFEYALTFYESLVSGQNNFPNLANKFYILFGILWVLVEPIIFKLKSSFLYCLFISCLTIIILLSLGSEKDFIYFYF